MKMAKYQITKPNGEKFFIHAPEKIHPDHVLNYAKNAMGDKQLASPTPAAPKDKPDE